MTCKNITGHTSLRLVYGHKVVILIEYIVPILRIVAITEMTYVGAIAEILFQLLWLEEDRFIAGYHQRIEKE